MQTLMTSAQSDVASVDLVEEMRMRAWARRHYAPAERRDATWHPIVLDEMDRKDREGGDLPRRPR